MIKRVLKELLFPRRRTVLLTYFTFFLVAGLALVDITTKYLDRQNNDIYVQCFANYELFFTDHDIARVAELRAMNSGEIPYRYEDVPSWTWVFANKYLGLSLTGLCVYYIWYDSGREVEEE